MSRRELQQLRVVLSNAVLNGTMNEESLTFTLTQINHLVSNLNKKNFLQNSRQIALLVKPFGLEADRHLLRCLFSSIDFNDANQTAKNSLQAKLLNQELNAVLNKSSLITNICFAVDNCFPQQKTLKPTQHLFNQLFKSLNCSPILEVVISLALTHSRNPEFVRLAENHLKICLPALIQSYVESDTAHSNQEGSLSDTSPELLQLILSLLSHDKYKKYGVSELTHKKFVSQFSRDFPRDRCPLILAPLIYSENTEISADKMSANSQGILTSAIMDTSWASLVMDIGYAFTASTEECKNHLTKINGRDLSAQDIAKIIGLMCKTHKNLSDLSINLPNPSSFWSSNNGNTQNTQESKDKNQNSTLTSSSEHTTWKPEVFVQAIKEIAPNTNWKDVCVGLDHAEFVIKDRAALVILISIIRLGIQASGVGQNFPVECLYRHWSHPEGQLSLISMILKNPDVYSIADNIYTSVPIELLKTPPETDNKEIGAWKSVHLVEVLLYIAENGYYAQVLEHFKVPMQHCPDVLFMALLQISPPLTLLRQEIFQTLMPLFLGNHPNSGTILHHAWNATNFNHSLKHIIMHSMSDWYIRGENDQSRLTRILDVAQDLKALSSLLNVRSFQFVIDLACLASRREYLKLDKWLNDKIREHGESFVQSIVTFLQRRCPQIMGKISEDQIPKAAQLPHETLATMMSCLQACVTNVQQELADIIVTMTTHCSILLKQRAQQQQTPQAPPPGVLRRGLESTFSSSGANLGMFTGPSVDTLSGLSSNLAGLNLSGPTNGAFNFNTSMIASPSRLLQGQSNSPFQLPIVPLSGLPPVNNLGRIAPTPTSDKLNMSINNQAMPDMTQKVSKEVEDEANGYFQRIYNHSPHPTLSIDEVLDMLHRFQESQVEREREVQQCMVRNLFEEYRFFPQYPDKELQITAQLFGGIVERSLVPSLTQLGLALRCVLDALRKPEGSKMYYFGITALDRFKNKLHQYQNYCEYVKQIPHFKEFPAHLMEYVNYGTKALEPPNKPQSQALPMAQSLIASNTSVLYRSNSVTGNLATTPTTKSTPIANAAAIAPRNLKSIANATNINTLLVATADRDEKITLPPDAIQDKTAFIFNNLSQINMQAKCEELKEIMSKEYWAWLSQYMVLKRASIELNFHALYSNFLDALKNPDVIRLVTKETFRNIRVLLRSDKGIENFSDRSLLKNLGHWLGMMTLGRNRPILHIDLDLKSLLVEAYHKGQQELLYVVPFVAKIVESCAKSKAFKPPNPWTMGIMNVLAELHQEQNLKLNLKFEIEVLCKTLSIDIADLKPIVYLKDQERLNTIEYQLSQPNRNEEHQVQQQQQIQQQPSQPPTQQIQQQQQQQQAQIQQQQMQQSSTPQQMVAPSGDEQNIAQMASVTNASPSQSGDVAMPIGPPEPKYSYSDITVGNMSNLSQYIHYSPNIAIIHAHPQVKQLVRTAIERTISDWLTPVVERSVRIAVTTCEQILRKDFALDSDDNRLRKAAHYMVRNLTAGMAMITCRDQLNTIIQSNIKSAFASSMLPPPAEINELATQIANDNVELACAFIQKTATEKAIPEIEKRLTQEFEVRKLARQEGRRHCDSSVLSYQNARMPEQIRLKVGGISNAQFSVYDEFARNIPGFKPMTETDAAMLMQKVSLPIQESVMPVSQFNDLSTVSVSHTTMFNTDEIGFQFEELGAKMEAFLNGAINVQTLQVHVTCMHALLDCLVTARRSRDNSSTLNLLNKAVENIMEGIVPNSEHVELLKHYRDIHLRLLHLMQDSRAYGSAFTNRAITKCVLECREEIRYNIEAADLLISSNFVNISQFDYMLSQLMENGNNYMAIGFAMQLVQRYFVDDRPNAIINEQEFLNTIDFLVRLSTHPRAPEGLSHLVDLLRVANDPNTMLFDRSTTGPTQHIHSGITQARSNELNDPPGMAEKVEYLLKDWAQNYHASSQSRDAMKSFSLFVNKLNLYGVLKTDELITRFFRHATQWCINLVYNHLNDSSGTQQQNKSKIFHYIDSFVRLIALIVKYSGDNPNTTTKINLLNKILGIIVGVLLQDQEQRAALLQQQGGSFQQQDDTSFKQLGYHRLFIMLFLELSAPEPILENISLNVVTAFCHTYHILRPSIAPAFCYSWLELISHRVFIGRILALIPQQKGWAMYSQLLLDLFKYLAPFLRNAELAKPVQLLYKGTLRVLLVLLHDFPEFLCDYHFGFCDVIPSNCIQMRNLILAAFPRNMRLPDPFTPNLKVDMLTEITTAPRIFTNYVANIQPAIFKKDLDSYLKARAPVTFLSEMRGHLQISNTIGSKYNVPLMNALVLYVGTQAIAHIRSKNLVPNMTTIVHCSHMDIFQNLIVDLDHEGRYLFLNAVANQLRYPNSHTHYFSCTLLYLFAEANSEAIQEQITRVLLERLIVNRPHPWGLLITFIELIKNPIYKFWDHDFVHCAPEIEKLFESVARSCMVVKAAAAQQQSVEGELQECN